MKKIPAAPGRAVVFARSPPAGAFAGFVLSLSLISRPPPFSACRTASPARHRRKPASGRSTAPYRCCPQSGGCRCRRKDPADPANRMNRSDQSNRLALRFLAAGMASVCTYSQTAQPRSLEPSSVSVASLVTFQSP